MSRRAVPVTLTVSPSSVPLPQAVENFRKATEILLRIEARVAAEEAEAEGMRSDGGGDQAADAGAAS